MLGAERSNKTSYSSSARRRIRIDNLFGETPNCPTLFLGQSIEPSVFEFTLFRAVPIVSISLNYQTGLLKDEIGLEAPEHRTMHLKTETAFLELLSKQTFNRSISYRKFLPQSILATLFSKLERVRRTFQSSFSLSSSRLIRDYPSHVSLTDTLPRLRRAFSPQMEKATLLDMFRAVLLPQPSATRFFRVLRREGSARKCGANLFPCLGRVSHDSIIP